MSCYDSEHWLTSVISYDTDLWFCQEELENSPLCVSSSSSLVMTNLDSILKSRDIILATKVHLVKAMVFPVVMYGCESWDGQGGLECCDSWGRKESDITERLI